MPSFFHLAAGLGGTAIVVGIMALWLHEPQSPPLRGAVTSSPKKMVGNSALSHGGPSPNSSLTAVPSIAQFHTGQRVIVVSAEYGSHTVSLLPSPPDSATSTSTSGVTQTLSGGTVVIVSGMRATEPVPGRTEQYYEVTVPDGRKGWLSERVLRLATK
jgi:hypothetical protein